MSMTPEAKRALSKTIRELRAYLLEALHAAVDTEYRFSIRRAQDADLDEARTAKRRRFEQWVAEQLRAESVAAEGAAKASAKGASKKAAKKSSKKSAAKAARTAEDFRRDAEKQAAYTLLNRLVLLRLMEAAGLRAPHVITGGWDSRGYRDFRELAPALVQGDATEGYAFLLRLVFEDLAHDLPGLYGPAGIAELVPIGPAVLRRVVEALDEDALESCWTDDMTLGWVYQYWNDPERERLDDKLNPNKSWGSGKIEPHEIASKTQMFTERYMVDWLLQNSLGPMWLAMCKKHGWTPSCESDGVLARLEARRGQWRAKREAEEVELTELMPLHDAMERRWAYYVPQPIPDDAVEHAPETLRDLKLLDPAVGSGHFLIVAFDLLFALYKEEARHRGEQDDERWSDRAIVERILEHNLHGIDLDPRAVQIAAAALWIEAKRRCPKAEPGRMNLVASKLRLASLPEDDPALVELRREVERETGIAGQLTDRIIDALRGADHLGSLLKVDAAVDEAIRAAELSQALPDQGHLFDGFADAKRAPIAAATAKAGIVDRLEHFLEQHGGQDDLGLRLRGEQLALGIRFLRMLQEGSYDLVVGNPPYQGTSKMADAAYVTKHYPRGKADLYAVFLERGLQLVRPGGVSALLTMRNWMFIKQYADLRQWLLETYDLRALGDFDKGAFEEVPDEVVSVVVSIFRAAARCQEASVALQPTPLDDRTRDNDRTRRKRAATLCHVGRHEFDPAALKVVPEWPLVYWWDERFLRDYDSRGTIGKSYTVRQGLGTRNNPRFTRLWWEVVSVQVSRFPHESGWDQKSKWVPFPMGAAGRVWFEPLSSTVNWSSAGVEIGNYDKSKFGRGADLYFRQGIVFSCIGTDFSARMTRHAGVLADSGPAIFHAPVSETLALLNSAAARAVLSSLNPTVNFNNVDVNRLPLLPVREGETVRRVLERAFLAHEKHRECAVEFVSPGSSAWRYSERWAQTAIDAPQAAPIPSYQPKYDPAPASDHVSFALGVALGRFGTDGEGILDPATLDAADALPAGVLFLDATLDVNDQRDSLGDSHAKILHEKWAEYGGVVDAKADLRTYLRLAFFKDVHRQMYEKRPIHWPLSSAKKTFVGWVNIHRWDAQTLRFLLAEHLHAAQTRLDGELTDLRAARDGADKKAARQADKRYEKVLAWREELAEFVALVTECAEKGPPPTDAKCPEREVDAPYVPDLDDGVMINSAALWPLLLPQWKEPKKWYAELAAAKGKKDYDWSHLAMRYWPTRVDEKCQADPSLGVAHGCFWRYHPERAWAWELRLQDEIEPSFRIEEKCYDPPGLASGPTADSGTEDKGDAPHREAYLRDHAEQALAAVEKEALRRRGRGKDAKPIPEMRILEPGLWTKLPDECWQLELRIIDKQQADFRLLAPDECEARAAFEAANPELVKQRQQQLAAYAQTQTTLDEIHEAH